MLKRVLYLIILSFGPMSFGQMCPGIGFPQDGAADVPVDVTIAWPEVNGINGYLLSLGTIPGGTDILDREALGIANSYKAPLGLPENTRIFVSLSILLFNAQPLSCGGISFTTMDVTTPPPCTYLIAPDDNAANVTITSDIIWAYSPTATSYTISIGTNEGGTDLVNNLNVGNNLFFDPANDLPQDTVIFVSVVPNNENGSLAPCTEESFFTGAAVDICEPYFDIDSGELVTSRPEIEFPGQIGICSSELPYLITTLDVADGFRWYKADLNGPEALISQDRTIPITEPGRYILEAYNNIIHSGIVRECASTKLFTVVTSEMAQIDSIIRRKTGVGEEISVYTRGSGDYEYAIDDINGLYQKSPIFEGIRTGEHVIYVRDKNGCGTAQRTVDHDIDAQAFPKFFTPNGDGFNDFWQFIKPKDNFEITIESIWIFDRYGHYITQIDPKYSGWNGTSNGVDLPPSDYWFKAFFNNQQEVKGHFALKR